MIKEKLLRKIKCVTLIAVSIAITLLCAVLPKVSAAVQDRQSDGRISYSKLQTVKYEVQEQDSPDMLGKLYLLKNGTSVEFSAAYDEYDRAMSDFRRSLEAYVEAGVLGREIYDADVAVFVPWLCVSGGQTENNGKSSNTYISNLAWEVQMNFADSENGYEYMLYAWLDDETGEIIMMNYIVLGDGVSLLNKQKPSNEEYESFLQSFYGVYMDMLDRVNPKLHLGSSAEMTMSYSNSFRGAQTNFKWLDSRYGKILLEFSVYENGFDINISV